MSPCGQRWRLCLGSESEVTRNITLIKRYLFESEVSSFKRIFSKRLNCPLSTVNETNYSVLIIDDKLQSAIKISNCMVHQMLLKCGKHIHCCLGLSEKEIQAGVMCLVFMDEVNKKTHQHIKVRLFLSFN